MVPHAGKAAASLLLLHQGQRLRFEWRNDRPSHEDTVTGNRELLDAAIGLGDNIAPIRGIRIV